MECRGTLNRHRAAAFPLDVPGMAILLSSGPRLAKTAVPALTGALDGIGLRTSLGAL
jgi:hypothetical protein